jgi:hypothetical protein
MTEDRAVRIAYTDTYVTFTQRGLYPYQGFIRLRTEKGKDTLISGRVFDGVFYPRGKNKNVPYEWVGPYGYHATETREMQL